VLAFTVQGSVYVLDSFRLLLPKPIDNSIPSDAEQPCPDLFYGLHQPIGFNKFRKNILQDVLYIGVIRDTPADKIPEP
jgi:hypothetical protein